MKPSVSELVDWLRENRQLRGRGYLNAVIALRAVDGCPDDVAEFSRSAAAISARLDATPLTQATYASRARTAAREFMMVQYGGTARLRRARHDEPRFVVPLTFEAQMNEALASLSRWPALQAYVLPALVAAQKGRTE